jgi:hypothetical protein
MSNRYEREIEEILRNLEHPDDPKVGRAPKFGDRPRPRPEVRVPPPRRAPRAALNLSLPERLLVIAVVLALLAGGYAFLLGSDIISFVLAVVSTICLILVACSSFLFNKPRRSQSLRYGNITITPIRQRNPFSNLKTRWNLFLLKLRYRGKRKE